MPLPTAQPALAVDCSFSVRRIATRTGSLVWQLPHRTLTYVPGAKTAAHQKDPRCLVGTYLLIKHRRMPVAIFSVVRMDRMYGIERGDPKRFGFSSGSPSITTMSGT